jgi:hypothetical protein
MFRKFAKTLAVSLPVLYLASALAVAQMGVGGGTGAPGNPGGPGSPGAQPGVPGTLPSNPGPARPGDTLGRPGDPGNPPGVPSSPPAVPDTTNPALRDPAPPGTSTMPETSSERELRQQGEMPRTTSSPAPQRPSGIETPSSPSTSVSGTSGANSSRPR